MIDLDALGEAEKENWVWDGADCLPPEYRRCLVSLSRGGADADVVREFDLVTRAFVKDGFVLPEAKSSVGWIDHDTPLRGHGLRPGSMTTSGYPRIVKEWKRGTPLAAAETVYEGQPDDVAVGALHDDTPGFERDFVYRGITFYTSELFLRRDGKLLKIEKPDDANASVPASCSCSSCATTGPSAGGPTPPARCSRPTSRTSWPASATSTCCSSRPSAVARRLQPDPEPHPAQRARQRAEPALRARPARTGLDARAAARPAGVRHGQRHAVDDEESDDYFLTVTDFLTPTSLSLGTVGGARRRSSSSCRPSSTPQGLR